MRRIWWGRSLGHEPFAASPWRFCSSKKVALPCRQPRPTALPWSLMVQTCIGRIEPATARIMTPAKPVPQGGWPWI